MSLKHEFEFGSRFLAEALPLVASYFSGEQVPLASMEVALGQDADDESVLFESQIQLRHALTCCAELIPIIQRIEENVSSLSTTVRTKTRGIIRGRLDIPTYVAQRSAALSWPKSYPVLVSEASPGTAENLLTRRVLRDLLIRLGRARVPARTAEGTAVHWYRHWLSNRLRRTPWCDVMGGSSVARLQMEASRRVSRRQTGNERAYCELLRLVDDWQLAGPSCNGGTDSSRFVRALLSFPADDSFMDRIYEIWCIHEIASCLTRIGASLREGPLPLTNNRRRPIYTFQIGNDCIEVWFQRALDGAAWSYEATGKGLRGIPDITIVANERHYFLADAKNRLVRGNTRSEETYKMLGYFENFRSILEKPSSWGMLAFVSYDDFFQSLRCSKGRRIAMISASPRSRSECSFSGQFTKLFQEWLNVWRKDGFNQ